MKDSEERQSLSMLPVTIKISAASCRWYVSSQHFECCCLPSTIYTQKTKALGKVRIPQTSSSSF